VGGRGGRGGDPRVRALAGEGRDDLSKLDAAFFTMNGVISITFFAFVLAERVLGA
jgi:hypothetical protein